MRSASWLLALALLTGCAASAPNIPLSASATTSRFDEGAPRLSVALRNTSSSEVKVSEVRLSGRGLSGDWVSLDRAVAGKDAIAFKLPYDEGSCVLEPGAPAIVVRYDGESHRLPLDLHPSSVLQQISTRQCALATLNRNAAVKLLPGTLSDGVYRTALEVRRLPGSKDSLAIVDLGGSVLLRMSAPSLPVALDESATIPLTISPASRCDGHAQSQSSQTFLLSAFVSVKGADPPLRSILRLTDAVKADLQQMISEGCGEPAG